MTTAAPLTGDRLRTRTGRRLEYVRRHPCGGHFVYWRDERLKEATWVSDAEWRDWRPVPVAMPEGRVQ